MSFRTIFTLALAGLTAALPEPQQVSEQYLTGLKSFLENANPESFYITGIDGKNQSASYIFDSEWRAQNGLLDPRYNTYSVAPADTLNKRYLCGASDSSAALLNLAYGCHDYLYALGTTSCSVSGRNTYVTACSGSYSNGQSATVKLTTNNGLSSASSYCSDVAVGLEPLFANCHNSCNDGANCYLSGSNAANGNGNLEVVLVK